MLCRSSRCRSSCPAVIVPRSSRRRSWCPPATPKGGVQMRPGARTDVGPPLRFLTSGPRLGFGAWALGGTGWGATSADRDRVAIATKVGPRDDPRRALEASLRRLATEYVDLIQLHEALAGWERQLERLHALQEEGKALS